MRSDVLPSSGSYPPITLTVDVNTDAPANVVNSVAVSGGGETFTSDDSASDPTVVLVPPANLLATATSTTQVSLTWNAVAGTSVYQVFASSNNGPFALIGSPTTNSLLNSSLTPNTTYVYFVRATDGTNTGLPSNRDLATTIVFTDDPIVAGSTLIKAVHFNELRTAVNAVRAAAGLPVANFTDTLAAGGVVKAVHVTELRSYLAEARSDLFLPIAPFTDPSLAAGDAIIAAHIVELRNAVK
jgi:hypothetical protein